MANLNALQIMYPFYNVLNGWNYCPQSLPMPSRQGISLKKKLLPRKYSLSLGSRDHSTLIVLSYLYVPSKRPEKRYSRKHKFYPDTQKQPKYLLPCTHHIWVAQDNCVWAALTFCSPSGISSVCPGHPTATATQRFHPYCNRTCASSSAAHPGQREKQPPNKDRHYLSRLADQPWILQ